MRPGKKPVAPIPGGSSFCWHCGRNLGGHSQKPGERAWAVVADRGGAEHRVHKNCVSGSEKEGNRFVRDEGEKA